MIAWTRQGDAYVGSLTLNDGCKAKAVMVAGRANPKGVVIVYAGEGGVVNKVLLVDALAMLSPELLMHILCAQERAFGQSGLPELDLATAQ